MQAGEIGQRFGAIDERLRTPLHEGRSHQKVFRRVAAQAQLRREHDARAFRVRATGAVDDFFCVAVQIAHCGIDLREGDFHR